MSQISFFKQFFSIYHASFFYEIKLLFKSSILSIYFPFVSLSLSLFLNYALYLCIFCLPPWAHRRTPRKALAWAPAWSRGRRCAGAPACTAPWGHPAPPSGSCQNTPLCPTEQNHFLYCLEFEGVVVNFLLLTHCLFSVFHIVD